MRTYTATAGDTFSSISTIVYGEPGSAELIKSANPQADGGLTVGMTLIIPDKPLGSPLVLGVTSESSTGITVKINGLPFLHWESIQLERSIDSFDRMSLVAPYEPDNLAVLFSLLPFKFQSVQVFAGIALIFTGFVVRSTPELDADRRTIEVECYALSAALNDVSMPIPLGSSLEYNGLNLEGIAIAMGSMFGIVPIFNLIKPTPVISTVAIAPTDLVLPFWIKLAQQRNLVIGNNEFGQPVFQRTTLVPPIQNLKEGSSPVTSVRPLFNPQEYYSSITGVTQGDYTNPSVRITKINPFLLNVSRPLTFQADDTFGADILTAVNAKMGRMFANAIQYVVSVTGTTNAFGQIWKPNTRINLTAPSVFVLRQTQFVIRTVRQRFVKDQETSHLTLVLPESFEGRIPTRLPWT